MCCAGASSPPSGGPSKCCYADTSFCCPTADSGCCMNDQMCGTNGCEGTASFVVQSATTTTTLYTTNYTATITTTSTAFSTFLQTSMQLLTTNVTSGGVATATSTVYVKSTRYIKRDVPELAAPSAAPAVARDGGGAPARPEPSAPPPPLTAAPASPASAAIHDGLAAMGLVRKRTVTSVVYTYSFVWVGVPGATTVTKLVVLPVTSLVNSTSTVTNTIISDASVAVTVTSTITVDTLAAATVAPDPTATTNGTIPAVGAGAAATGAPGGDGFDSASQGTSPTAADSGPGSSSGVKGNGTTESAHPAAPPPPPPGLGAAAKAWQVEQPRPMRGALRAMIGAGAAVAGLAFLGLALILIRRHRANNSRYSSTPAAAALAGPPYGTGSSTAKNGGSWMLPVRLPPPPPLPPPVPPRHPANTPGGFPAWLTEAAASRSAISLGGLARHVSNAGGGPRQSSAVYSVSDYGDGVGGVGVGVGPYDPAMAPQPLAGPPLVDVGPRRWTVEMDSSAESLGAASSERTFGAGPVYDPARYMEAAVPAAAAGSETGCSRELREAPGQARPLLGSYGR
ncbi:hypothetical protein GGTG_00107 [Gaeumannomyces tritici R3-111a-1]|uniref:Uncharacterized protein n=1 Tax=Gaeumannomyces tritici (strain R3-111a-1) TaxID=644352 RepID=J3NFR3_GAET3|nr:hypothetical protein GGTG_00107 [Gaeumannomyces tritici R3-111a-1]EJT80103.1 hypothetical protein GGTG_00107 [Gaeumannomyces tritici R3-111a-1]